MHAILIVMNKNTGKKYADIFFIYINFILHNINKNILHYIEIINVEILRTPRGRIFCFPPARRKR